MKKLSILQKAFVAGIKSTRIEYNGGNPYYDWAYEHVFEDRKLDYQKFVEKNREEIARLTKKKGRLPKELATPLA